MDNIAAGASHYGCIVAIPATNVISNTSSLALRGDCSREFDFIIILENWPVLRQQQGKFNFAGGAGCEPDRDIFTVKQALEKSAMDIPKKGILGNASLDAPRKRVFDCLVEVAQRQVTYATLIEAKSGARFEFSCRLPIKQAH